MRKKTKKRLRRWIIAIVLILILSFSANIIYKFAIDYYRNYFACEGVKINHKKYKVFGIDVSSHQKRINWERVAKDNIQFCFLKATEGKDFVDKRYKENYLGARENGLFIGAYHFFRFASSGKEQAKNFINNVAIDQLDLPPVLDVERHGNYFAFSNLTEIRKEISAFLKEIEDKYGISPIIYTNIEGYEKYIKGYFDNYQIWICRLCNEPQTDHWTFWQYSHKGKVSGIETDVDLNTFNGDKEAFENYIKKYKELHI